MGYDALELRQQLAFRGTASVIPSQPTRKHPWPLDTETYKERNLVERGFSRLKDFRRIATRYDKLARNFPPPLLWLPSSRGGPDRVWSLGWQRQQREIVGDSQSLALLMPTGAIADHDGMGARGNLGTDLFEVFVHGFSVGRRHDDCGTNLTRVADGAEQIDRIVPIIAHHRRA